LLWQVIVSCLGYLNNNNFFYGFLLHCQLHVLLTLVGNACVVSQILEYFVFYLFCFLIMICRLWNCQPITSVWGCMGTNEHRFRHIGTNAGCCTSRYAFCSFWLTELKMFWHTIKQKCKLTLIIDCNIEACFKNLKQSPHWWHSGIWMKYHPRMGFFCESK